jgi:hypothetical protein
MNAFIEGRLQSHIEANPSPEYRRLASIMIHEAARVLGIAAPAVHFYYRAPTDTVLGYASRHNNEIFIAAGLSDAELCEVITHECRHVWQFQDPEWRNRADWLKERDATIFELSWPR